MDPPALWQALGWKNEGGRRLLSRWYCLGPPRCVPGRRAPGALKGHRTRRRAHRQGRLCGWESGEGALGQEGGEVGARKEVQVRDAKPTCKGALSLPWLWAAQWGVRGKGTAGGASRGRPLTPRRRGPTCCLRRRLPGRCGPKARPAPLAGRTAGRAPLPTRPSCSGRTGRVACGGGGPRARPPGGGRPARPAAWLRAGREQPELGLRRRGLPQRPGGQATNIEPGRPRRPPVP